METKKQTQMRRTYDVLNILNVAEVLQIKDKRYFYNPVILEGEEEASIQCQRTKLITTSR